MIIVNVTTSPREINVNVIKSKVPLGGTTNQVLAKSSNADYDVEWKTFSGGGGGAVDSVFGRTGDVVAQSGDYTTAQVTESGNLYYTEARVSANADVTANTAKNSYPSADQTKLGTIETGAQVNTIDAGDNVSELVNDAGYTNDSEWSTSSGTRSGGDLTVRLGDYDDSNNGTGIEISDAARNVKLGDTQENQNGTILEVDDSNGNVNLIAPVGKASIQTSTFDINLSGETAPTVGQVLKVKSLDGSTATINFQDESGGGGGDSYVNYKTSCRSTMNTTNWFGISRDYSTQVYNFWVDTGTTTELNVYNNATLTTAITSWFTAPFDLEIERIILNIENERTFTIQFSIGSCDRADGGSTVNNPTTLYTSGNLVKTGSNWFKQELTTADFGTLSVSQGDCVIPLLKKVSGDSSILRVNNFEIICKKV